MSLHGHIYVDLAMHVARHCNSEIDGTGRDALYQFIRETVVAQVEAGGDYFGFRNYYLQRFAAIAGNLDDNVPPGTAADRDHVLTACHEEVEKVRRIIGERRDDGKALSEALGTPAPPTPICFRFHPSIIGETPPQAYGP